MKVRIMSEPSYYAIIPAHVRYANIPANAKLLYGEITALSNKHGYCYATNDYFAKLYQVSSRTICDWIGALTNGGFIKYEVDQKSGNKRRIFLRDLTQKTSIPHEENFVTPHEENFLYNNTSNNNTSNNPPSPPRGEANPKTKKETQNGKTRGQRLEQYLRENASGLSDMLKWAEENTQWDWSGTRGINSVFEQFRDYWKGCAGSKGVKADWPATWRNWCRREAQRGSTSGRGYGTKNWQRSNSDIIAEQIASITD